MRFFRTRVSCVLASSLLLTGLALAGCGTTIGEQPQLSDPSVPTSEYVIGPGDHLQIFVYDAPSLSSGDTPVRPDGRISMPLVPEMVAAGKTPLQLSKDITAVMKTYIKDPNVSVIVHSFVGPSARQIKVIGEATDPIALPYSDHMTVLDVMIAAKGLTRYAAGNSAIIVRRVNDKQVTIKVRLYDLIKQGDVSQNMEMRPGDTLIIPQSFF
jgi:polysaccharide export outer membrane protein